MLNVLLIDDDDKLAELLLEYCAKYEIDIVSALTPSAGLQYLKYHHDSTNDEAAVDAIILDVMLPEMDGFEVCREIRKHYETPVIMLTARGDVTDRVVGLELGADDYLPKPFDPRELVARIHAISKRKRSSPSTDAKLEFKDLAIDPATREVRVKDKLITLTTMEYQLLLMMAKTPGKDYSRDDILNVLKGTETELFSRSVDILVSRLRAKLKPAAPIKTVYGAGYAFVGTAK